MHLNIISCLRFQDFSRFKGEISEIFGPSQIEKSTLRFEITLNVTVNANFHENVHARWCIIKKSSSKKSCRRIHYNILPIYIKDFFNAKICSSWMKNPLISPCPTYSYIFNIIFNMCLHAFHSRHPKFRHPWNPGQSVKLRWIPIIFHFWIFEFFDNPSFQKIRLFRNFRENLDFLKTRYFRKHDCQTKNSELQKNLIFTKKNTHFLKNRIFIKLGFS